MEEQTSDMKDSSCGQPTMGSHPAWVLDKVLVTYDVTKHFTRPQTWPDPWYDTSSSYKMYSSPNIWVINSRRGDGWSM